MFRRELRLHIWAFILLSLGGLLLHTRIHKPLESAFNWLPVVVTLANAVLLPLLFNSRRTVAWGYLLNLLTVGVGTATMAWFSFTHWKGPVTPWTLLLNSTLADILILNAKLPLAHLILQFYLNEEREPAAKLSPEQPADITTALPLAGEVRDVRPMPSGLRILLGGCCALAALAVVGVAAAIGLQDLPERLGWGEPVQTFLICGGRAAGTTAAAMLMLQFVLASRLQLLDRIFALDRLLHWHKMTGSLALTVALAHPALLYAASEYELGPVRLELWGEGLGILAALAAVAVAVTSSFRLFLGLSYEAWRRIHFLAFPIVLLVGAHSLNLGSDLESGWPRLVWMVMLGAYVALFLWVKVGRPALLRSRPYTVEFVGQLTHDTYNLRLSPTRGAGFGHVPGQFAFLTLRREGLPTEAHPFTISSAPVADGSLSFIVKESGDFTSTVGRTRPGDAATVEGPYGRFSCLFHDAGDLVLIAGGVGITPFLSVLRYLAVRGDDRRIMLIWGNKTEADITLPGEFSALAEKLPNLTIHHVLSEQADWPGERGYLDAAMLVRLLGEVDRSRHAYVCGPPVMMDSVTAALRGLGFRRNRIHTERFAFDSEILPPMFRESPARE